LKYKEVYIKEVYIKSHEQSINIIMLQNKNNPPMKKKENLSTTNYKKMCIDETLTFITFYLLIKF